MGTAVQKSSNETRKRNSKNLNEKGRHDFINEDIDDLKKKNTIENNSKFYNAGFSLVTVMSIFTTFYKIWYPAEVVFDEVHFGKFAGYYLQRSYFFDVHPPLAKLMLAAVGYLIGFDGVYQFDNIGESYADHQVPYIPLRTLPALLNVLSTGLIYSTLKESGYSVLTCFVTATLYVFDNAFVGQHRLILLDSMLVFYMLTSIYSYVQFRKHRHMPFTNGWWRWLITTGVCMALTLSVKMVGMFVFLAIGILIIKDLWELLDIQTYRLSHEQFLVYFGAHALGFIIVPIMVYMFWFYVHFSILTHSGPGDFFMSPQFQDTLTNSPLRINSLEIMYNQSIRLQHKDTQAFLHGNGLRYPIQYHDGRYSSQGLQITGNLEPDLQSYWRILPGVGEATGPVKHQDIIRLEHIVTGQLLLTHDVASPWMPTNQEFTLTNSPERASDTLFRLEIDDLRESIVWTTLLKPFRLVHVNTNVALWCNKQPLPEWGLNQLEINGNKKSFEPINRWVATDILGLNATEINLRNNQLKKLKKMGFLSKFFELQKAMIIQNSKLVEPHPFQSRPESWPIMSRGISYWTHDPSHSQIYLTGNIVGWWIGFGCIFIYSSIVIIETGLRKRGINLIKENVRNRLNRTGGLFLLLWSSHYLPFFLMGRSLYLHHYLPAMACNYLLIGSLFDFLFVNGIQSPISYQPKDKWYNKTKSNLTTKSYISAIILVGLQFYLFIFLSPLTYGSPGLSEEDVTNLKLLNTWDIRFAKFI